MKIQIVCDNCGSTQVLKDAWAKWDVTTQEWVLNSVHDYMICDACGEETKGKEIELSPTSSV